MKCIVSPNVVEYPRIHQTSKTQALITLQQELIKSQSILSQSRRHQTRRLSWNEVDTRQCNKELCTEDFLLLTIYDSEYVETDF